MNPHPSRRTLAIRQTIAIGVALFAVLGLAAHPFGCAPSAAAKATAADEAYKLEHMRCVAQHETNAEIDDCRARVRERWGITTTVTKDGGR